MDEQDLADLKMYASFALPAIISQPGAFEHLEQAASDAFDIGEAMLLEAREREKHGC
mgnify:CR=1 FL=1